MRNNKTAYPRFTDDEIKILSCNPYVKNVSEKRLTFTFEFRKVLYDAWIRDSSKSTIRSVMESHGIPYDLIGMGRIDSIVTNFKKNGLPSGATNNNMYHRNFEKRSLQAEERLLKSGFFKKTKDGVRCTDRLIEKLLALNNQRKLEDNLESLGISCEDLGYSMICRLKKKLGNSPISNSKYSDSFVEKYCNSHFVKRCTKSIFSLSEDAIAILSCFTYLGLSERLYILGIDIADLPQDTSYRIARKARLYIRSDNFIQKVIMNINDPALLKSIEAAYNKEIELHFDHIKTLLPHITFTEKKTLCRYIHDLKKDYIFSTDHILKHIGLSRSHYYHILSDDSYGMKEVKDRDDFKTVMKVVEYKGYDKGVRTIHMMMENVTGVQFSVGKIRRLLRKNGVKTDIRKKNKAHQATKKHIDEMAQPNYLKRMFRLGRPGMFLLTDVTYLKCSDNKTRYFSAVKDAVTGRIYGFEVSDYNDLKLAIDTLEKIRHIEFGHGCLYHTDQGSTYLSKQFQEKVEELGFVHSMSRRGNCWDNAPMESFWGHFKDECDYKSCASADEMRTLISDYIDYYNNERPQWSRHKMTPVRFENYLRSLSNDEYNRYVTEEYRHYELMIKNAGIKAKKRAIDIGA